MRSTMATAPRLSIITRLFPAIIPTYRHLIQPSTPTPLMHGDFGAHHCPHAESVHPHLIHHWCCSHTTTYSALNSANTRLAFSPVRVRRQTLLHPFVPRSPPSRLSHPCPSLNDRPSSARCVSPTSPPCSPPPPRARIAIRESPDSQRERECRRGPRRILWECWIRRSGRVTCSSSSFPFFPFTIRCFITFSLSTGNVFISSCDWEFLGGSQLVYQEHLTYPEFPGRF
jgi:hypothetical protein